VLLLLVTGDVVLGVEGGEDAGNYGAGLEGAVGVVVELERGVGVEVGVEVELAVELEVKTGIEGL
jgi:hypothetical protein